LGDPADPVGGLRVESDTGCARPRGRIRRRRLLGVGVVDVRAALLPSPLHTTAELIAAVC